jgi:hypothetical protein
VGSEKARKVFRTDLSATGVELEMRRDALSVVELSARRHVGRGWRGSELHVF